MAKELISRDQVCEKDTWNVKDVYASEADWEADINQINERLEELVAFQGKVCESAATLLKVLELAAAVGQKVE